MSNDLMNARLDDTKDLEDALSSTVVQRLSTLPFTDIYFSANGKVMIKGFDYKDNNLNGLPASVLMELDQLGKLILRKAARQDEFFLDFGGIRYRIAALSTVQGQLYVARRAMANVPNIQDLNIFTPTRGRRLAAIGHSGGLILIAGRTGNGKTTTAYSLLKYYLSTLGNTGITIEDPVEMTLSGPVGKRGGYCFQTELKSGQSYSDALKVVLRAHPRFILLGEMREAEDAYAALRAAISGHLVISTIHAGNVQEAIEAMIVLAASKGMSETFASSQLSTGLVAVIHQRMMHSRSGKFQKVNVETLFIDKNDAGIRNLIKKGDIPKLGTYIAAQASEMKIEDGGGSAKRLESITASSKRLLKKRVHE
ncbi:ATPase, T2SS/T4P/T4SS family [Flexibacterium corallicola]|uniref:ATPase, T2SS/T4P/T4SS family n=1 Tax=Flexibacterium corallicola TaxID=3037259 RepID=UPI00286F2315|nr:ATPase, T2SS/T4P/T4SS family [Pseudovibrio sp. M1P-2-3]